MHRGRLVLVGFTLSVATACGTVATSGTRSAIAPTAPHTSREAEEPVATEPQNDADLPGLEPDAVVAVVRDHQGAVNGCHAVGTDVGTTGSVTLTWSIAPSGQVEDVEIAQSTFENTTFHECIVAVIAGLDFPAAPGSTEVGGWRFRFRQ